ncbi:hypothetical protein N0V85_007010 [Neurospora sp. IMI 360204]|nr:hypothetical protein N0V85_007010 [Neurospora sp. IMI 360204]
MAVYLRTTGSLDTYFKELKGIQDQFAQKLQPQFRPSLQLIQNDRGLEANVAGAGSRSDAKRHKTSARGDLHATVDGMAANFNAQILAMRAELDKLGSVREDLDRLTETMGDTLNRLTGVEAENRELKKQNYELKEYAVYFFRKNHELQDNGELCSYQGPFKDRDAMRRHYKDYHVIILGTRLENGVVALDSGGHPKREKVLAALSPASLTFLLSFFFSSSAFTSRASLASSLLTL